MGTRIDDRICPQDRGPDKHRSFLGLHLTAAGNNFGGLGPRSTVNISRPDRSAPTSPRHTRTKIPYCVVSNLGTNSAKRRNASKEATTNPETSRVILLIRRSRPYWIDGTIDPSEILPQDRAEKADAAIKWWDRTFSMTYEDFRRRVHNLAKSFYLEAKFDEVILWHDRRN